METKVKENGTTINNKANDKKDAFVNNNPVNNETAKAAETGKEKEPASDIKAEQAALELEAGKAEARTAAKPALNLTETIMVLEELHRLTVQRNKLLVTIGNLEAFEVELKEDFEETAGNFYQVCSLTIKDDNRRKFTTKNPVIIWTIAQNINSLCVEKLADVEARIVIAA